MEYTDQELTELVAKHIIDHHMDFPNELDHKIINRDLGGAVIDKVIELTHNDPEAVTDAIGVYG